MPDADFRFVNVARWESPEVFRSATARLGPARVPFAFHAALYDVVHSDARSELS